MSVKRSSAKCPRKFEHLGHEWTCGNTYWDFGIWEDGKINWDSAECTNCGFERTVTRRKPRTDKATPTQLRKLEQIKRYLERDNFKGLPLHSFKWELTDYGAVNLVVETLDDSRALLNEHWHIIIGRRGKIMSAWVHCMISKPETEKLQAKGLIRHLKRLR